MKFLCYHLGSQEIKLSSLRLGGFPGFLRPLGLVSLAPSMDFAIRPRQQACSLVPTHFSTWAEPSTLNAGQAYWLGVLLVRNNY